MDIGGRSFVCTIIKRKQIRRYMWFGYSGSKLTSGYLIRQPQSHMHLVIVLQIDLLVHKFTTEAATTTIHPLNEILVD